MCAELGVLQSPQTEDAIVSQWGEVSADKKPEIRHHVNEILRLVGNDTKWVLIRRANSIAILFLCMTLSAVVGLREQWQSTRLRVIVEQLFTVLSGESVYVKRLIWPQAEYDYCLSNFHSLQG